MEASGVQRLEFASAANSAPIGAVVLGGDYQGLGIARSLGRRDIPICVIDDEYSITQFSRYAKYSVRVPTLRNDDAIVKELFLAGERFGLNGWILYPTRDEIVAALSRHKSVLEQTFRVPTAGWETIQWLSDKRNTYHLASCLNIPIPATYYPVSVRDLDQIQNDPPFAIKPAIKEHFFYTTKVKAWRANTRKDLNDLFRLASAQIGEEVIVQDLIPGGGEMQFSYCAFYKGDRALGSMTCRRARQHPPEFGRASTFVETVDLPELEELSARFLNHIHYYGLVEMEYKLDPRDGQYKLLDVNGRTWGYHTLGQEAGVDFSRLLFEDQNGAHLEPARGRAGVKWVRLVTDLPTGFAAVMGKRQTLGSYLRSLRNADTEAVFSREDFLPAVAELALLPYLAIKRGF